MAVTRTEPTELDVRRPLKRADAVAAGVPPTMLRGSRFRRIFRGVYISRETPVNPFVRTDAALALHPPTAFASHVSAARVYRLPVPTFPDEHVTVLAQEDRRKRPGVVNHVASSEPAVVTYRRLRVVPAAGIVAEAMVALVLADVALEKFGGDSVAETARNVQGYLSTLRFA